MTMLGVFFPALMGVGILASGFLLIMDWARRLVPNAGVRRRIRVVRASHRVAESVAAGAGIELVETRFFRRVARSRWTYLAWGSVTAAAAIYLVSQFLGEYDDAAGLLYENPWALGLAVAAGVVLGPLALVVLAPGFLYRNRPRVVEWIVGSTWLGRTEVTGNGPDDGAESAPPAPAGDD